LPAVAVSMAALHSGDACLIQTIGLIGWRGFSISSEVEGNCGSIILNWQKNG